MKSCAIQLLGEFVKQFYCVVEVEPFGVEYSLKSKPRGLMWFCCRSSSTNTLLCAQTKELVRVSQYCFSL